MTAKKICSHLDALLFQLNGMKKIATRNILMLLLIQFWMFYKKKNACRVTAKKMF